jgi:hypothetical protein
MPPKKRTSNTEVEELLSKLIAITMWSAGASQGKIARAVGKSTNWVNDFLKGVPKPVRPEND